MTKFYNNNGETQGLAEYIMDLLLENKKSVTLSDKAWRF